MDGKRKRKNKLTPEEIALLKIFGADLAAERKAQDKTQMDVAICIDSYPNYVSKVEKEGMEPGLIRFLYLAAALNKRPEELLKNVWPAFLKHYKKMQKKE